MSAFHILAHIQNGQRIHRNFRPQRARSFDLPENEFINSYRLTKPLVLQLIEELRPYIQPRSLIKSAIPVETKVLCALRFFATGSDQRMIADDYKLVISQQSVSRVLREVCDGMDHLLKQYVTFPSERSDQDMLKVEFHGYCGLSGVIGAIDCTHVAIIAPVNDGFHNESNYVNRKGFHSMNVQLVCDMKQKILNVVARFPGSCHDSYIWRSSNLRRHFDYGGLIKGRGWLLGDSGYPSEPWLKTPISNPATPGDRSFNNQQARGRAVIERVNGTLKSRFRCLKKVRTLHYEPVMASKIINACVVLHNKCIESNLVFESEPLDEEDEPFNTGNGNEW